jgi:hypothetical protein
MRTRRRRSAAHKEAGLRAADFTGAGQLKAGLVQFQDEGDRRARSSS